MYEPPYTPAEIRARFPKERAEALLADPVHKFRAESGIELIHLEPIPQELKRIWRNWQQMTPTHKKLSDAQSRTLFGLDNQTHYMQLQNNLDKPPDFC